MRIQQISVTGLFGIFNHVIPLNTEERITIIHGPNGFGKTAILRMINGFFNSRYSELRTIPFSNFKIKFDDGSYIDIIKYYNDKSKNPNNRDITFNFYKVNTKKASTFSLKKITFSHNIDFPLGILDDIVPGLERVAPRQWIYLPTEETLSLSEVIDRFEYLLPSTIKTREEPDWLQDLKQNIHVRLIESQRLLNLVPSRSSKIYERTPSMLPTVSAYSDELARLIKSKLAEYGTVSQSLDRTFPKRVVQQQPSPDLTTEKLREKLDELEKNRTRLVEVGLLDKDENSDFYVPHLLDVDERTQNILSVYVEDVEKKLSVFSEVASKIELLRRIINKKSSYSYKEMKIHKEKGFIFKILYTPSFPIPETITPTDLSSGEQHELVLLYELLFKVKPDSLVLIDEPELSLHVGWQVEFLQDLQDITELVDLDILMATHSPAIIDDRWDLTVGLKGPTQ